MLPRCLPFSIGRWRRAALAGMCAAGVVSLSTSGLQTADANGDTRALHIKNTHNGEAIDLVFKRDGRYDQDALTKFNHFLRDWRTNDETRMDPRLLDLVWEVYRDIGGQEPIHLVSSYRTPQTNNFLRTRSAHTGVAKHSQHTLGKAMDFFVPGVPLARVRERGMLRQKGGVGFYPTSGSPFVHLDVGNVRAWPRMTREQLVRLFPNGHTLHLPADGGPLPGYEEAVARLGRDGKRGDTVLAYAQGNTRQDADQQGGRPASNILASLFGGGGKDEDEEDAKPQINTRKAPVAARAVQPPTTLGVTPREAAPPKAPTAVASVEPAEPSAPRTTFAPRPLPRPFVTAALEAPAAAPVPPVAVAVPVPEPRPVIAGIIENTPVAASLGRLPPLPPVRGRDTLIGQLSPSDGLQTRGDQVAALAPLAARLREQVATAALAKLDYRRLDRRTFTPLAMVDGGELTAPSIGNLGLTMGPAMVATHFGRRPVPILQAFAGPAIRSKRASTI